MEIEYWKVTVTAPTKYTVTFSTSGNVTSSTLPANITSASLVKDLGTVTLTAADGYSVTLDSITVKMGTVTLEKD